MFAWPIFQRSIRFLMEIVCVASFCAGLIIVRNNATEHVLAQSPTVATVSAASYSAQAIAPESLVASFGTNLATATATAADAEPDAPGIQLPTTLAGTTVEVNGRRASLLYVSPDQINCVIPGEIQPGSATVVVRAGNGVTSMGMMMVSAVAPAIFTANGDGKGVPAAKLLRVKADGTLKYEDLADYDALLGRYLTRPINLGPAGERVFLILFASGLRRAADPNNDGSADESVRLTVGGTMLTPAYAGRQPDYAGLDQINLELPRSLVGRGVVDLNVTVNTALPSQTVQIELAAVACRPRSQ
jgi:uncharacterized protein (TIGR03437 family)